MGLQRSPVGGIVVIACAPVDEFFILAFPVCVNAVAISLVFACPDTLEPDVRWYPKKNGEIEGEIQSPLENGASHYPLIAGGEAFQHQLVAQGGLAAYRKGDGRSFPEKTIAVIVWDA